MTPLDLETFLQENPVVTYLAALTVVIPWLLAIIYRSTWSSTVKGALTVAACFVASLIWMLIDTYSTHAFVVYGAALVGLTGLVYRVFKPSLKELEERT